MPDYQNIIKDNTVQVENHEHVLTVLDFGNWESGKICYYKSLLAHKSDMKYAEAYLKQMFFSDDTSLIDGALINSAIQLLIKCFTNPSGKGRRKLDEVKVFRTFAPKIGEVDFTRQFSQLYDARNHVISHDQINYTENLIGLVVNSTDGSAEDIAELTIRTGYLYKQNQETLLRMVRVVLKYLDEQIIELKQSLLEKYNSLPKKPDLTKFCCENTPVAKSW